MVVDDGRARTNWAGNYRYGSVRLHTPRTLDEVRRIVAACSKLTAVGSGHSFNGIGDNNYDQISLAHFDGLSLDGESNAVTVGAGVTYGRLAEFLWTHGYALHNLASLPHISVAGAVATATHGSGDTNGNLATSVSAFEIVTAEGNVVRLSRDYDGDSFQAAVVGLGGFGIVTQLTLHVERAFSMSQVVYENLPLVRLESHLDDIFSSGYSVSLFLTWQDHEIAQAWIKRRVEPGDTPIAEPGFFGATPAEKNRHPVPGGWAGNCTQQLGVPGPWHERLLHFRVDHAPSTGAELQSEYFVPRERAYEAILAVERLAGEISPLLQICELRSIDADTLWLSPFYKRKSVGIHFTWKPDEPAVRKRLIAIEALLAPFDARPHWGKLFAMQASRIRSLYERYDDWTEMRTRFDPHGKFSNEFLETALGTSHV